MNEVTIDVFMDACRDFEAAVKQKYNLEDSASAYMYLASLSKYGAYRDEIHVIRTLRNMLAHNNIEINGKEVIHFSPQLLDTVRKLTHSITNPILVKNRMIKNIYVGDFNDRVSILMKEMKQRGISHIPILDENRKLLGVFSQSTLFTRINNESISNLNKEDTIGEYAKYLPIDMHDNESFGFIGCDEDIEKAKDMFTRTKQTKKRNVMLFVTKNGNPKEIILGILTPWDVIE